MQCSKDLELVLKVLNHSYLVREVERYLDAPSVMAFHMAVGADRTALSIPGHCRVADLRPQALAIERGARLLRSMGVSVSVYAQVEQEQAGLSHGSSTLFMSAAYEGSDRPLEVIIVHFSGGESNFGECYAGKVEGDDLNRCLQLRLILCRATRSDSPICDRSTGPIAQRPDGHSLAIHICKDCPTRSDPLRDIVHSRPGTHEGAICEECALDRGMMRTDDITQGPTGVSVKKSTGAKFIRGMCIRCGIKDPAFMYRVDESFITGGRCFNCDAPDWEWYPLVF